MFDIEELKALGKRFPGFELGQRVVIVFEQKNWDEFQIIRSDKQGFLAVRSRGANAGIAEYIFYTSVKSIKFIDCKIEVSDDS